MGQHHAEKGATMFDSLFLESLFVPQYNKKYLRS